MKKTILTSALCLSLLATGCVTSQKTPASESETTAASTTAETTTETTSETTTETTTEETTEETTTEAETTETSKVNHQASVEVITVMSYADGTNELNSVYPKVTVDGKEAADITNALKKHIQKKYPMKKMDNYVDGWSTRIAWGVKDNMLSIVIHASDVSTDYFTNEAFNYDLNTLKEIKDKEVTKRFGMKDADLFSKTKDVLKKYCSREGYDEKKTVKTINYDTVTPYVTQDGKLGVAAPVYYAKDSQFSGESSVRCFYLTTMEYDAI